MRNKGQITMMLILGVIILFSAGTALYVMNKSTETNAKKAFLEATSIQGEAKPVVEFLGGCFEDALERAAYFFGYQQGFSTPPYQGLDTEDNIIAYYYDRGENIVPSLDDFEHEFSLLAEEQLTHCTDLEIFEDLGFTLTFEAPEVTPVILDEHLDIVVDFPITISKEAESKVDTFRYEVDVRLGLIHESSQELVRAVEEEPWALDYTLLLNQEIDASVLQFDECNTIYIFQDETFPLFGEPYVFTYAVRVEEEFCEGESQVDEVLLPFQEPLNHPPTIEDIPYLVAEVDVPFTYQVLAEDQDNPTIFFLGSGILKDRIHPMTGEILYIPQKGEEGIHYLNITVVDVRGEIAVTQFYLEVS